MRSKRDNELIIICKLMGRLVVFGSVFISPRFSLCFTKCPVIEQIKWSLSVKLNAYNFSVFFFVFHITYCIEC